jgi:tRNA (cytidine/uridine-2'-O-)-methyltransferase
MRIALFQPDIAGNVGTILRLAACLGAAVDLIEPMGFAVERSRAARAAMDYEATSRRSRAMPIGTPSRAAVPTGRLVLFTTRGATRSTKRGSSPATPAVRLGKRGAPDFVHDRADLTVRIPLAPDSLLEPRGLARASGSPRRWPARRRTLGFPAPE